MPNGFNGLDRFNGLGAENLEPLVFLAPPALAFCLLLASFANSSSNCSAASAGGTKENLGIGPELIGPELMCAGWVGSSTLMTESKASSMPNMPPTLALLGPLLGAGGSS